MAGIYFQSGGEFRPGATVPGPRGAAGYLIEVNGVYQERTTPGPVIFMGAGNPHALGLMRDGDAWLDTTSTTGTTATGTIAYQPTPPAHAPGLIWEDTTTLRVYQSTGTRWRQIGGPPAVAGVVTVAAPFTSYPGVNLPTLMEAVNGWAELASGIVMRPTAGNFGAGSDIAIVTLPPYPDLYPTSTVYSAGTAYAGGANSPITLAVYAASDGTVHIQTPVALNFNGGGPYNTIRLPALRWPVG